jgi:hypothetical protein
MCSYCTALTRGSRCVYQKPYSNYRGPWRLDDATNCLWGPSVSTVAIATIIPVLRPSLLCRIHCTRGRSINLTVSGPRRFRWLHTSHVRIQHIALSSSMEQREQHARWSNIGKACSWGAMPACLLLSNQWARASYASRSLALASW